MKFLRRFHCPAAWPPWWLVTIFVFAYGVFEIGFWLIEGTYDPRSIAISTRDFAPFFAGLIGAAAVLHVVCRLFRFHPRLNLPYASWLSLSPWNSTKPLPLGPVHPVWQDAAVMAILAALARWNAHVSPMLSFMASGMAYLVGLTLLLWMTSIWPTTIAVGFLWPTLILTQEKPWPTALTFAALSLVLWAGTRRSFQTFPWQRENRATPGLMKAPRAGSLGQIDIRVEVKNATSSSSRLGWPYAQLSPKVEFASISTATSFWTSLLAAWWGYCIIISSGSGAEPQFIYIFGLIGAFVRVATYWHGLSPAFSFHSRIFSGRWIVPGFDQIFATPLLAVAVTIAGAVVDERVGAGRVPLFAIFLGLTLFILLAGGPTMRDWVLAGKHRFRPVMIIGAQTGLRSI